MLTTVYVPPTPNGKPVVEVTHIDLGDRILRRPEDHTEPSEDLLNATGFVTIVEVGDYACPDCRSAEAWNDDIFQTFEHVQLVYLPTWFDKRPRGELLARLAEALRSDPDFWTLHKMFCDDYSTLTDASIHMIANTYDVMVSDLQPDDLFGNTFYTDHNLSWVPTYFVNGIPYFGESIEPLKRLIENQLELHRDRTYIDAVRWNRSAIESV